MTTLIISNVMLWIAVLVLAVLVLSLARQISVLHERVNPAGALMMANEIAVGDPAPSYDLEAMDGQQVSLGKPHKDGHRTLLYFMSPTCPICSSLLSSVRARADADPALEVLLMSNGPEDSHAAYRKRKAQDIGVLPYILSEDVNRAFGVSKLPYAVLIDGSGIVRAHGLINTREHLESLFEAEAQGLASAEETIEAAQAVEKPEAGDG